MEQKNALFEQMPVRKAFFKLALPVVLSMVVSLVYNMVDTYFIAKTGNAHLVAGVALGSPVFTLMIAVGDIFGLGGSSFISRLFGQKRDQDGKRLSVFCFYGALFTGVGITALLLLLRTPRQTRCSTPGIIIPGSPSARRLSFCPSPRVTSCVPRDLPTRP